MGAGTERASDQQLLELGAEPHVLGKLESTGRVVRIVKREQRVKFSEKPDWILVDMDLSEKGKELKWLPGNTRFTWVREFNRD